MSNHPILRIKINYAVNMTAIPELIQKESDCFTSGLQRTHSFVYLIAISIAFHIFKTTNLEMIYVKLF